MLVQSSAAGVLTGRLPLEAIFVRTGPPPDSAKAKYADKAEFDAEKLNNMCTYYSEIFQRDVNTKWLKPWIEEHIAAGRIPWMWWKRSAGERGFMVDQAAVINYLQTTKDASKAVNDASQASLGGDEAVTQ